MAGSIRFSFESFGVTHIDREIRTKGERADNFVPALERIDVMIEDHLKEQFATEGAAGGARWAPLKQATIDYKRRNHYPLDILRRTDALMKSLTESGAEGALRIIGNTYLVRGSTVEYGRYHQHGTRTMPARPIFHFTEVMKRNVIKVLQRYIMTGEL